MRIAILQGHPDPSGARYGRALAQAYAKGARETLIGSVETCGAAGRERWLEKLRALGRAGR